MVETACVSMWPMSPAGFISVCALNRKMSRRSMAVPKLCQNPTEFRTLGLTAERKHLTQVIKNKHIRMEQMDELEAGTVLRNQQVAGSIPAGGSSLQAPIDTGFGLTNRKRLFLSSTNP
jgi:hypothetical protein